MGIPASVTQTPPAHDQATAVVAGAFTVAGVSPEFLAWGPFNLFLYGNGGPNGVWQGIVQLERSFDGGNTWLVCGVGGAGAQAVWGDNTVAYSKDVSVVVGEPEKGMLYRLDCTGITTGTVNPINYRMSATGQANQSLAIAAAI